MNDASPVQGRDADRARELRRIKLAATLVLVSTAVLFMLFLWFRKDDLSRGAPLR